MRTTLGTDNPYGHDRYGFAWERFPVGGRAHLDFGCGDGRFLATLASKNIKRTVGVDVDRDAVQRAEAAAGGRYEVVHIGQVVPLPFADKTFSSVTLMDVLEHVDQQRGLLDELHRILDDDGMLIVTVPGRHLFSFLDMGNLKFRFPRLHRWYYCRGHGRPEYDRRYGANPDGLIGDVSATKRRHEHFSRAALERLLIRSGFVVADFDGTGYFIRALKILRWGLGRSRWFRTAMERLMAWDARRFETANVFCIARKRAS